MEKMDSKVLFKQKYVIVKFENRGENKWRKK